MLMNDDSGNLKESYHGLLPTLNQPYIMELTEKLTAEISDPEKRLHVIYGISAAVILRFNVVNHFNFART